MMYDLLIKVILKEKRREALKQAITEGKISVNEARKQLCLPQVK